MKKLFLSSTIRFLNQYKDYTEQDMKKLEYGLEGIYLTLTKLIIIIILSILLNIFKETIFLLLLFNIIRYFGFGIHARKSSECLISSVFLFIVMPYCIMKYSISFEILFIISILSIITLFIWAPADTIKRPFKNRKKRIIRKILTVIVALIYLIIGVYFQNHDLSSLFLISIIIQAIMVNPLTYKLFRQPFNNYKKKAE